MRNRIRGLAVVMLVVGTVGTARADVVGWIGSLGLEVGTLPPIAITGSALTTVNGSSGGAHLVTMRLNMGITGAQVVPVTDPIVTQGAIVEIQGVVTLGQGTLRPFSSAVPSTQPQLTQNTLPIDGIARICLVYSGCNSGSLDLDLSQGPSTALGVGGLLTLGGVAGGFLGIRVSVVANPWTLKTVTLSNRTDNGSISIATRAGFRHGPASSTSSTAATSGVVQLVTPLQVTTIGVPGNNDKLALFGVLTVHFVPEPGQVLMLLSGVAGLALLGWNRTRD